MNQKLVRAVKSDILNISYQGKVGHIGSALSAADILIALYFKVAKVFPNQPDHPDRDRILLSKGHAAAALYACLYRKGIINRQTLYSYHQDNTLLPAHPEIHLKGVDFSSGSLGHGLAVGAGMALAAKIGRLSYRTFVIISDGECDEGSTWEAALIAAHQKLNNLTVLIDYNQIQAFGRTNQVVNIEPLKDKWRAFGWRVVETDGHNLIKLTQVLSRPAAANKPTVVICHTVLGKGISFMENNMEWHYWNLDQKQLRQALKEIGGKK